MRSEVYLSNMKGLNTMNRNLISFSASPRQYFESGIRSSFAPTMSPHPASGTELIRCQTFGNIISNQKGASVLAVVAAMLILGVMGVTLISLVTTGSDVSINQLQSEQALQIAAGGVEYGKRFIRPYSNWYSLAADPYNVATNQALGNGTFTTDINFPATTVKKSFGAGATVIRVFSVDRFPASGTISLDGGATTRTYTGTAADAPLGPRFTGVAAGSGGVAGTFVYPVVLLSQNTAIGATTLPFNGDSSKFLSRGTLYIDDAVNGSEEVTCSGIQTTPTQAFTGCMGTVNPHNTNNPILPIQSTSEVYITSTGSAGNARRVISDVADQ